MRRTGLRHLLAGLALLLLAVPLIGAASVGAQEVERELFIRQIDSGDPAAVQMDFVYSGDPADVDGLTLTENGQAVTPDAVGPLPVTDPRRGVIFVVDTSDPMDASGALVDAKEAISAWIAEADPTTEIGLIAANADNAVVLQELSTDRTSIQNRLDEMGPTGGDGGHIWRGVKQAGAALADDRNSDLQGNVVVVAGSNDPGSFPQDAAVGELMSAGAAAWSAVYTGGTGAGAYQDMANRAGGAVSATDDPQAMSDAVAALGTIVGGGQYQVTFASTTAAERAAAEEEALAAAEASGEEPEPVAEQAAEFDLQVGGLGATATVLIGGEAVGKAALNPDKVPESVGIPFLQGTLGLLLAVVVTLLACVLLAYGITSLFVRDDTLADALQPYSEAYGSELTAGDEEEDTSRPAILQRAVAITEQVAESQGYLSRTEAALERANLPLRAGEALFFYAAIVLGVTLLGLVLFRSLIPALILGVVAALVPPAVVNFKANQRRRAFMSQLPDTLQLLSGTLRAGYSLMQGVEAVSQEVDEPMGQELRRVVTESRLGRPLEESLESAAERMDSPDFAWAVMAIRIQREVGGNLAELLLTVADTMVARERLRRDVASLTAEGRVSAMVLGLLPIGLGAAMYVLNPDYIGSLFDDTLGIIMLILAGVSMLIGFFWMKKIIDIEI